MEQQTENLSERTEPSARPSEAFSRQRVRYLPFKHWQVVTVYLMLYDLAAVNTPYFAALWLRFDCRFSAIPSDFFMVWLKFVPIYSVITLVVFWFLRLYKSLWRFASFNELTRVLASTAITAVLHAVGITLLFTRMPISYYIVGIGIQFLMVLAVRFSYRLVLLERGKRSRNQQAARASQVMLIGADCHNMRARPPRLGEAVGVITDKLGARAMRPIELLGREILSQNEKICLE